MSGKSTRAGSRKVRSATAGANPARGEHSITLSGRTWRLRPSFAAITAIEEALDRSALELLRAVNAGSLGYSEMGVIVAELIRAGAEERDVLTKGVSAERMAELIYEEGQAGVLVALTIVLASAVSGGRTASGEAKAVTGTTTAKAG